MSRDLFRWKGNAMTNPGLLTPPKSADELERELKKAYTYIGRLTLFLMEHGLDLEWSAKSLEYRAQDAAEAARNPSS